MIDKDADTAPVEPQATDGLIAYYAHVKPENLVTWAASAMAHSYSPYSRRKEGVLIRTERGDVSVGTNVETINWDGLTAIEVAIGRLFVQQPWLDPKSRPEKISDILYALENFDPGNPDSYVPDGRSLEWLKKFGSPDTVLHFAIPGKGILSSKILHELLPYGPRMKPLTEYLEKTGLFRRYIDEEQTIPDDLDAGVWHGLRRSRLHAFAPYSLYRVGIVIEADTVPVPAARMEELEKGFAHAGLPENVQKIVLKEIFQRRSFFSGINVELSGNSGLHGEGCAIGAMVTDLGPDARLNKVYLQGGFEKGAEDCTCCGKCRQLIAEFSTASTEIIPVAEGKKMPGMSNRQLLPGTFDTLG